jgi:hypothetical protein
MSRMARLAEREELSSNPLRRLFNDLRTTQIAVDVDWRIMSLLSWEDADRRALGAHPALGIRVNRDVQPARSRSASLLVCVKAC